MKIIKRTVITLIVLLILVVGSLAGTVAWVFENPRNAWHFAEKHLLPADLKVTWQKMDFTGNKLSIFDFDFDWTLEGLKITKGEPALNIPIDKFRLRASAKALSQDQKLVIHDLQLVASEEISFLPEHSKKSESSINLFQQTDLVIKILKDIHRWVSLENIDIDIKDFQLASKNGPPLVFSLKAHQGVDQKASDALGVQGSMTSTTENPMELNFKALLSLTSIESTEKFLSGDVQFKGFGTTVSQKLSVQTLNDLSVLQTQGPVEYQKDKLHLIMAPALTLKLNQHEAETILKGNIKGIPGPLMQVTALDIHLKTPLDKNVFWGEKPSDFEINAPINVFFIDEKMRQPFEQNCACKLPEALMAHMKGQIWFADLLSKPEEKKPVLETHISLESVQNKLMSLDLAADLKIEKKQDQFFYSPSLDCKASVNSFQGLNKFLDAKGILVPAPLNVLEGTLTLLASGPIKSSDKDFTLPLSVTADLRSSNQMAKLKTQTSIRMNSDFKEIFIDVLASVDSLQLELPPLDPLKGKPRITPDKRILKAPVVKQDAKSAVKVYFSLEIETSGPGAIRLLSPFFHPYLPLSLSIHQAKAKNSGYVQTEPFEIEYLRRKVQVEKMRINLPEADDDGMLVDARFKIKQTQYTIFIDVTGPINNPDIVMNSEPYLSENEIISVLLYDRTNDQLASADAETAGGVQAAVADRAIGLFGLWAFAATPIKSFSYNPVTKIYTATVAITDDLTAGIGTTWEAQTRLELRKRVSRSWMLTAAWTPATQEEPQSTKLVLQWEKRF